MRYLLSILVVLAFVGCDAKPRKPKPLPPAPPMPVEEKAKNDPLGPVENIVEYTPSAKEPPPKYGNFGYKPDKKATKEFLRSLDKPTLFEANPKLKEEDDDQKRPFRETNFQPEPRGPPAGAKEPVLLYRALYTVAPGWKVGAQGIGDCVSWGWAHAADVSTAVDKVTGRSGDWKFAATEPIYGGSRVEARGKSEGTGGYSDGSYGSAAAKWFTRFGVVHRVPFPEFGYDLTKYDKSRAKSWGNYGCGGQGDNGRLDAIARKHPAAQVALVRTFEEAAAAIDSGYPVPVCSGQGFSSRRDKDGFSAPSGGWSHCMCFTSTRYEPRPGLLCQNSWGTSWISGPKWPDDQPEGSFWVDASVVNRMLAGEDSFAVANIRGFPKRKLRHELGW